MSRLFSRASATASSIESMSLPFSMSCSIRGVLFRLGGGKYRGLYGAIGFGKYPCGLSKFSRWNCCGCGACTGVDGVVADEAGGVDWAESCAQPLTASTPASIIATTRRQAEFKADKDIRLSPCIRTARDDDKGFSRSRVITQNSPPGFHFCIVRANRRVWS